MQIVDDEQLLQLSAQPSIELWPILDRARAFNPLVVLLVILPASFAWYWATPNEQDGSWGLYVLQLSEVDSPKEMLDPVAVDPASHWNWFPPLGTWLQAAQYRWMKIPGVKPLGLLPPLHTILLITVSYAFVRSWTSARFALWFVVLMSFQGSVIQQAQSPMPVSLALLFGLVSLWGILLHILTQNSWLSWPLVWGGVCLGLCLLTGGPIAILVLLVSAVSLFSLPQVRPQSKSKPIPRSKYILEKLLTLTILGSLMWLAGGWWLGWMSIRAGDGFFITWLLGAEPTMVLLKGEELFSRNLLFDLLKLLNGMLGFLVIGVVQAVRMIAQEDDVQRKPLLLFLLIWFCTALAGWLGMNLLSEAGPSFLLTTTQLFLTIPTLIFCTFALEEIARRHVSGAVVMGVCLVMLAGMNLFYSSQLPVNTSRMLLTAPTSVVVLMLMYWGRNQFHHDHVSVPLLLSSVLLCTIFTHLSTSFLYAIQPESDNKDLKTFEKELTMQDEVNSTSVITRRQVPARLKYLCRSQWPAAEFKVHSSWESVLSLEHELESRQRKDALTQQLFLIWNLPDLEPAGLNQLGVELVEVAEPIDFGKGTLRAFRMVSAKVAP